MPSSTPNKRNPDSFFGLTTLLAVVSFFVLLIAVLVWARFDFRREFTSGATELTLEKMSELLNLPPVGSTGRPELRILRRHDPLLRGRADPAVGGYILTTGEISYADIREAEYDSRISILSPTRRIKTAIATDVLGMGLEELDGRKMLCAIIRSGDEDVMVADDTGPLYAVEGFIGGRRFRFDLVTAFECEAASEAQLAIRAMTLVETAAGNSK